MTLRADEGTHGGDGIGDVTAYDDLIADGSISIYATDNTIYLGADVYAGHNILLNNNTKFIGWNDQLVEAGGTITANGWLKKLNYNSAAGTPALLGATDGSCYIIGKAYITKRVQI